MSGLPLKFLTKITAETQVKYPQNLSKAVDVPVRITWVFGFFLLIMPIKRGLNPCLLLHSVALFQCSIFHFKTELWFHVGLIIIFFMRQSFKRSKVPCLILNLYLGF